MMDVTYLMRIRSFRILISLYQWRLKTSITMSTFSRDLEWMNSCVKWVNNMRLSSLLLVCQRYYPYAFHSLSLNTVYIVCRSCFGQVGYTQCRKASVIQGSLLQLQRHLRQGRVHCCLATMWITSVAS